MPSSSDKLVEIPPSDWPKLSDLYADQKDELLGFNIVKVQINCIQQNPEQPLKIYSLNGDWEEDGTFIVEDHNIVQFQTQSKNNDKMLRALKCLNADQRNKLFYGFSERLESAFEQYYLSFGKTFDDRKLSKTFVYHATKKQVEKFKIEPPKGITLSSLKVEHAELINYHWPHRGNGSLKEVERVIRYNPSVGAFNEDGQLIAWTVQLPMGAIGILHVMNEYKRKGLGSLLVRAQAKQLAEKGFEVIAPVVLENIASCALFKSLGFRVIDQVYWAMGPDLVAYKT